jgi:hypothetical protein
MSYVLAGCAAAAAPSAALLTRDGWLPTVCWVMQFEVLDHKLLSEYRKAQLESISKY